MTDSALSPSSAAIAGLMASAERFSTAFRQLPEQRLLERMTVVNDEWSPRDIAIQHIIWTTELEEAVELLMAGREAEYFSHAAVDFANVNAAAVRRYRDDSKMALMMGLHAALSDLRAALEATPEMAWMVEPEVNGGTMSLMSQVAAMTRGFDRGTDEIVRWLNGAAQAAQ
jgi:hypothetical protein